MENEFIIKQVCILFHLSEKNQYYGFRIENKRWDILKACNFINLNIDEWICKIQKPVVQTIWTICNECNTFN